MKIFELENDAPLPDDLSEWTVAQLKEELGALRREGARGFWDHDACNEIELELQKRPSFFK